MTTETHDYSKEHYQAAHALDKWNERLQLLCSIVLWGFLASVAAEVPIAKVIADWFVAHISWAMEAMIVWAVCTHILPTPSQIVIARR